VGNPRLPKGPKPHDVRVREVSFQLRLTGPEREALDRIAERAGISAAEVVLMRMPAPLVSSRHTSEDFLPKTRRVVTPRWAPSSMYVADDADERIGLIRDCAALVEKLRFDATSLPLDALEFEVLQDGINISARMLVPDRARPGLNWIQVWRNVVCPWGPLATNGPDHLVRMARDVIAGAILHEVDEALSLDCVRVFDPHRALLG
jgi:hypothetical protein